MHTSQRGTHITSSHKSQGTSQRTGKKNTRDGGWRGVQWTAVFRTIKPQQLWLSEQDLIDPTRNNSTVDKSDSKDLTLEEWRLEEWRCSRWSNFSLGVQQRVCCPCSSGPEACVNIDSSNQTQWVKNEGREAGGRGRGRSKGHEVEREIQRMVKRKLGVDMTKINYTHVWNSQRIKLNYYFK